MFVELMRVISVSQEFDTGAEEFNTKVLYNMSYSERNQDQFVNSSLIVSYITTIYSCMNSPIVMVLLHQLRKITHIIVMRDTHMRYVGHIIDVALANAHTSNHAVHTSH